MSMNYDEKEISFDIVEHIGILSTFGTGWTKELNLVGWYHLGVVIKHHTINP